jgi:serine/threonine-protein kinase
MAGVATKVRVRQFGPYVLGRRIGSGGMATVFAARQVGARGATRVVAVKVMATALADDPAAQQMFEREVVIATRVEHPNIVRTYEVGEVSGEIFLAMELVRGATLSTLCARSPGGAPVPVAVRIACDVARGLHAVHELRGANGEVLGVVHQDVTPHNVIVDYDGPTKLLDFGVARMVSRDGSRTERVRGKPAYLAPEQVLLERIDRRADIYALGAVLYELLTGARSSTGAPGAEPSAANDVRALRADVPEPLARVVARALEVDPERRFVTADEMRRALGEARDAGGIEAIDESEVAAWARAVAPPPWSLEDLERELSTEGLYRAEVAAVADLPTVSDAPPVHGAGSKTELPGRRRARALLLALPLVVLTLAFGAWRHATRRLVPAIAPPSGSGSAAAAPAGSSLQAALPLAMNAPESPEPTALAAPGRSAPAERRPGGRAPAPRPVVSVTSSAEVPAEAVRPTLLSVWSSPWGHVAVDGIAVGDSPVARLPVTPGSHVIRITTVSGGVQQRAVPVKAGEDRTERFVF